MYHFVVHFQYKKQRSAHEGANPRKRHSTGRTRSTASRFYHKAIRYDHETRDYNCYLIFADGTESYIGSRSTYGQGEERCNTECYKLLENTHSEAEANQEAPAAIPDDVVTVKEWEGDEGDQYVAYCTGDIGLTVTPGEGITTLCFKYLMDMSKPSDIANLRARSFIFEHPDIRRLIGRDTPQTPVEVERWERGQCEATGVTFKSGTAVHPRVPETLVNVGGPRR